ncbi:hypothetical protein [Thalassobacillus hwangdonensis]|uniref:Permease n=1 Tax=Thalassobacillus hwangdonensis TaxID=546108 RepID=A0ABW3L1U2_9BACI
MKKLGLYVVTPILSYAAGITAFITVGTIVRNESIGSDLGSVLLYGAFVYLLFALPIYYVTVYFIGKRYEHYRWLYYPAACMLVFMIPTAGLMITNGREELLSPEALVYNSFFLGAGLVFGLGSWYFKHRKEGS